MNFLLTLNEKIQTIFLDVGLLSLRIWVGLEFIQAGYRKMSGGLNVPNWFSDLDFPFPLSLLPDQFNWLSAGVGELVLGTALLLGIKSRFASLGLLYITYVAIYTVHFDLGWAGWNQIETDNGQGFKVPLMLALMLLTIFTQGSGKYGLEHWQPSNKKN